MVNLQLTLLISQTPGSNARDVIQNSLAVLDEASKSFPAGYIIQTW